MLLSFYTSGTLRSISSRVAPAFCLIAVFLFFHFHAHEAVAQLTTVDRATGTVVATITDTDREDPLIGVNVILSSGQGAATDAEGRARISGVPAGQREVEARFVGYRTAQRTITVEAGETVRVRFALAASPIGLGGIEVTALSPSLSPSGSIDAQRVREIESDDTGGFLRSMPGVGAARRGPLGFDPNVRGLSETEVGVYVGGMRTFPAGPLRMDSPLSHVDPSSVASIEVVKGPYALTWGPGNMSAIRAEPRGSNPPNTPLTGSVEGGFDSNSESYEGSAFLMGRQGRVYYSAGAAYRTGGDYASGDGTTIQGDYTSGEARGHLGVQLTPSSTLDVRGSYQEQLDIDYPGRLLDANFFRTGMGALEFEYAPGRSDDRLALTSLEVRAHAQQTLHEMDNENKPTFEAGTFPNGNPRPPLRISVDAEIQNFGGRAAATFGAGSWTAQAGGDLLFTYREARRPFRAVRPDGTTFVPPFYDSDRIWPGVTVAQQGVFLNLERPIGSLQVSATGRLDLAQTNADDPTDTFLQNARRGAEPTTTADLERSYTMLGGALTASLPLSSAWSVSAGIGSVTRPPDALELYADRFPATKAQTAAEFQGNPFLDPERSTQADLWVEGATQTWSMQLSGFARRLDNYITLEPTDIPALLPLSPPQTVEGEEAAVLGYTNGEATFYGAEVQGSVLAAEGLRVRAAGSYLWGRDETLDEPALGVSPPSASLGARWTLPIEASGISRWYLDGSVTLTAEQDRVAISRNEGLTEGYAVVDLQTGARLVQNVELQLSVENVFDVDYTNHLNARNPFGGTPVAEPGRVFSVTAAYQF